MAVLISLNDNSAGDGFLLAPLDSTYDAQIKLKTDPATPAATVTLRARATADLNLAGPAGLVFSTMGPINITPVETTLTVHAMTQSATRGDTTIQVLEAGVVVASFSVTCIKHPVINFTGRFQARFATDNTFPNTTPQYTSNIAVDPVPLNGSKGWTWALEGEPLFVPAAGNIPTDLEMTGMGRIIRLNGPVAMRSPALPVISTVKSISGQVSVGNTIEKFTTGDAIISQPVNFGPDTYFAGNGAGNTPIAPAPEEFHGPGQEPLACFEINIGNTTSLYFKGASQVGVPGSGQSAGLNRKRRSPDSRPYSQPPYIAQATAPEMAEFSLPDLLTFTNTRIDALVDAYQALDLAAGDSLERRSLVRRIGHLIGYLYRLDASDPKIAATQALAVSPDVFARRMATLTQAWGAGTVQDWDFKEHYVGKVDTRLHAQPGGSSVIDFLRQFVFFDIDWRAFAFQSDELCGHHIGALSGNESMTGNHIGDPHVHTVDGTNYDFQSVGEFTLLRDGNQMEVQVRQTPVGTANPITDSYSGLTACVSLNTAVAAKVGYHRVSYQPFPDKERARLQFFLDGKPAQLTPEGINLNGHTVSAFDADGQIGLRIDYKDKTVVTVTPRFWDNHNVWYMNVSVSNTKANEGVMGHIPKRSWLPRLRNGEDVGPRPANLNDRFTTLYKTFADSWRVTNETSLFVYAAGTSTKTFTDPEWPAEQAPCNVQPQLAIAGATLLPGMPVAKAELACKLVTMGDLNKNCVFDVATTGDETFVKGYLFEQELRLAGTSVHLTHTKLPTSPDRSPNTPVDPKSQPGGILVVATVKPITAGRPTPKGAIVFYVDDKSVTGPVPVDQAGDARWKVSGVDKGNHSIKAVFIPEDKKANHGSTSTILTIGVPSDGSTGNVPGKGMDGASNRWYIWAIFILLILLLIWCLFFRH